MLTSLALIFLTGLLLASLFEKLKLPRIIGKSHTRGKALRYIKLIL